tara:strand:+ start:769 stop:1407 length:639 start_codon:yes stop_codon:yes gene_type:complete
MANRLEAVLRIGHARTVTQTGVRVFYDDAMGDAEEDPEDPNIKVVVFPGTNTADGGQEYIAKKSAVENWGAAKDQIGDTGENKFYMMVTTTKSYQVVIGVTNYMMAHGAAPARDHLHSLISDFTMQELIEVLNTANFIEFKYLFLQMKMYIANKIINAAGPQAIRKMFEVENEFDAEEKKKMDGENKFKQEASDNEKRSMSEAGSSSDDLFS